MNIRTKDDIEKYITEIVVVLIGLIGSIGWVMNIITIFHSNFTNISGELIARIIGVFISPVGAVLGWF